MIKFGIWEQCGFRLMYLNSNHIYKIYGYGNPDPQNSQISGTYLDANVWLCITSFGQSLLGRIPAFVEILPLPSASSTFINSLKSSLEQVNLRIRRNEHTVVQEYNYSSRSKWWLWWHLLYKKQLRLDSESHTHTIKKVCLRQLHLSQNFAT